MDVTEKKLTEEQMIEKEREISQAAIEQAEAAGAEIDEVKKEISNDQMEEIKDILEKEKDIDNMSYIELRSMVKRCETSLSQIDSIESFAEMYTAISTDPMDSDPLAIKIERVNSLKKDKTGLFDDISSMKDKIPAMKENIMRLKDKANAKLETFSDSAATTSFLNSEMLITLNRRLKELEEDPDMTPEFKARRVKYVNYKKALYSNRTEIVFFFLKYLAFQPGCTKELRKATQYLNNTYNKTFIEVKEALGNIYPKKQLAAFETALQNKCGWSKKDTVTLFTYIYRIITKARHTTIEAGYQVIINIMIMNINDIAAGIWDDEEMHRKAEEVLADMQHVLQYIHKDFDGLHEIIDTHELTSIDFADLYN